MKEAAAKTPPKPAVVSLAQLLTEQPAAPPPGWIEPGLLPPGGILFVGGEPKVVGGGEKGYQNGGEVVPCQGSSSESAFPSSQSVLSGTARSRQGRAVVGRGEANP